MSDPTIRKCMVGEFVWTVEPLVSDHPKTEDVVVAYRDDNKTPQSQSNNENQKNLL